MERDPNLNFYVSLRFHLRLMLHRECGDRHLYLVRLYRLLSYNKLMLALPFQLVLALLLF